jgi:hypothetical protein
MFIFYNILDLKLVPLVTNFTTLFILLILYSGGRTVPHAEEVSYTCEAGHTQPHQHQLICQVYL